MRKMAAAVLIVVAAAHVGRAAQATFTGALAGWSIQGADPGTFAMRDGVLHVTGTQGWLRSDRQYRDFTLRAEFRFLSDDADSGIYVRAVGATPFMRGWPNQSYQVQVRNPRGQSRFPPVGGLFRHGMPDGALTFDPADAVRLSRANGEWQVMELEVVGTTLIVRLNGSEISRAANIANPTGYVGIQAEAGAIEYRGIQIRER